MALAPTNIDPDGQIRNMLAYDDTLAAGSGLEVTSSTLEDNLHGIISQINRILNATAGGGSNWFIDVNTPSSFEGGAQRGVNLLNTDLHDVERKRLLKRATLVGSSLPVSSHATGTLTATVNFANTETVTLDAKTYTFQTLLTDVDGNVLIGGSLAASLANLANAINLGPGSGSTYAALMTVHPTVSGADTATTLVATAKAVGTAGNSIASTETAANASWGTATLAGGGVATDVLLVPPAYIPTVASSKAAIGGGTTLGTILATAASYGTAGLEEVTGSNALQPKNLSILFNTSDGSLVTRTGGVADGKQVYALFQSESAIDNSTITGLVPDRVQLSMVVVNGAGTDLELISTGDVPTTSTVSYAYVFRDAFLDCPEEAWLGSSFADSGVTTQTRQAVYDAQGSGIVTTTTSATLDIGTGFTWEIGDALNAPLFTVTENNTGSLTAIDIGTAVDDYVNSAVDVDFTNGIQVDTSNTINLGITADQIDFTGSGTVTATSGQTMLFTADSANATLSTTTSGNVVVNSVANVLVDGVILSLDGTDDSNLTMTANDVTTKTLTIAASNSNTGVGSIAMLADGTLDAQIVGNVTIDSSGGTIGIGTDANTGALNLGIGAAARTITMGNATGATSVNLDSGTGGFTFDSTVSGAVAFATVTTSGAAGDSVEWFVSDTDPSAGGGIAAPVGSTLWRDSGGSGTTGELWIKTGAGNTVWERVVTGVVAINTWASVLSTGAVTGGTSPVLSSGDVFRGVDGAVPTAMTIRGGDSNAGTIAGAAVLITGGDAGATAGAAVGGAITLSGGGSGGSGPGGKASLLGGNAGTDDTPAVGGDVDVLGGAAAGDAGGAILVQGGVNGVTGSATQVQVLGGTTDGSPGLAAGGVLVKGGASLGIGAGAGGGDLVLAGGNIAAGGALRDTGSVTLEAGTGTTGIFNTGDIFIQVPQVTTTLDVAGGDVTVQAGNTGVRDAQGGSVSVAAGASNGVGGSSLGGDIDITWGGQTGGGGRQGQINLNTAAISAVGQAEAVVRLNNQGSGTGGGVVTELSTGTAAPTHTAPAGSLFMFNDGVTAATGGRLYIQVDADGGDDDGSTWNELNTDASITLQDAYGAGNIIVTTGGDGAFDVSGSEAISLDASAASNFTVDSATLTLETTTSGNLLLDSAASWLATSETALNLRTNSKSSGNVSPASIFTGSVTAGGGNVGPIGFHGGDAISGTGGGIECFGGDSTTGSGGRVRWVTGSASGLDGVAGDMLLRSGAPGTGSGHGGTLTAEFACIDLSAVWDDNDTGTIIYESFKHLYGVGNDGDTHQTLNFPFVATSTTTGGIVVVRTGDATATTSVATGGTESSTTNGSVNPAVWITDGDAANFAVGDIVSLTGMNLPCNEGLFEIDILDGSTTPDFVILRGIGSGTDTVQTFTARELVTDTTVQGTMTKVTVCVMQCSTSGVWQVADGNNADTLSFTALGTTAGSTLQAAFNAGSDILVSAAETSMNITGTVDDATDLLVITGGAHSASTAGTALTVSDDPQATGDMISLAKAGTGTGLDLLNSNTTGSAMVVRTGAQTMLEVTGPGAVSINPISGQDATVTAIGTGDITLTTEEGAFLAHVNGASVGALTGSIKSSNSDAAAAASAVITIESEQTGAGANATLATINLRTSSVSTGGVNTINMQDTAGGTVNVATGSFSNDVNIGNTNSGTTADVFAGASSFHIEDDGPSFAVSAFFHLEQLEGDANGATAPGSTIVESLYTSFENGAEGNLAVNFNTGYTSSSGTNTFQVSVISRAGPGIPVSVWTNNGAATNPTVTTDSSGSLSAGDLVLLTGATELNNNGIFEVVSYAGSTAIFAAAPTAGAEFVHQQVVAETGSSAVMEVVTLSVLRVDTTGNYAIAEGASNVSGLTYQDLGTGAVTRQIAYTNQGATPVDLTTNAVLDLEGAGLVYSIRDDLEVDLFSITEGSAGGTSVVAIAAAVDTFDVDAVITDVDSTTVNIDATSASNLTVTGGTLTVSTVTSGALDVTSAGLLDIDAASSLSINSSGGAINVGDDANTGALNLGTGAAARTVTMGNATGATALDLNSGTGGVDVGLGGDTASFTVQDDVGGGTLFSVTRTDAGSAHEVAVTSTTATFDVDAATQTYDGTDFSVDMSSDINVTTTGGCLTLESTIADVGTVDIGGDSIYFHDAGAGDLHLVTQTEYVADAATTWGLSGIYKGSTVTTTVATGGFAAAVVAFSNATIAVVAEGAFSANDLIVVTGANNPCNNGLYEVQAVNEEQLELKSLGGAAPVTDFVKDQVVTDTTVAGTVTKISVCSLRCGTDGAFEVANFTDNTATYSDLVTSAVAVTRQHFQTTMTAVVSASGTITSSDITGTMPTKPSSGFIFDTDAEIYLNGLLLFNGTTNEVSTGSGDDIDVESGGPTFRIGDVITIIYHTNSVAG